MEDTLKYEILNFTGAEKVHQSNVVQELWSGYGEIFKIELEGGRINSLVVKKITPPLEAQHPRGWNSQTSHIRKLKSYRVELNWYDQYAHLCSSECRIPDFYFSSQIDGISIGIEDLDAAGYSIRKTSLSLIEIKECLSWLANFHATFMNVEPVGLWKIGTYWHLNTRKDEFDAMQEGKLQMKASIIDQKLNDCKYQTIVHGDAKLANFCFSKEGPVAALDFQYVGGGCGMKDVAYFIGSCLDEVECERLESELLDAYFEALKKVIQNGTDLIDFDELEKEWRTMYPYAWADFSRFLLGWSPSHHKLNSYSKKMVEKVLDQF